MPEEMGQRISSRRDRLEVAGREQVNARRSSPSLSNARALTSPSHRVKDLFFFFPQLYQRVTRVLLGFQGEVLILPGSPVEAVRHLLTIVDGFAGLRIGEEDDISLFVVWVNPSVKYFCSLASCGN